VLIEQCKLGNRKAQYEIYSLYSKAMLNIGIRMMNNREEAEDVLQETFIEVFKRLNTFRYDSSFGAWVKKIMVNKCINCLRKKKVELVKQNEIGENRFEEEEEDIDNKKLNVKAIYNALNKLPEGYRVVFSLYLIEGYDHNEISDILNISVSTSKSQFLRAKRKIKELINNNSYERRSSGAVCN